jgi:hypothetical protein
MVGPTNSAHPRDAGGSRVRSLFKFVFLTGLVLAVTALLGLFVMSSLARIDGVKSVPIPSDSYISGHARRADYADAYRVEMEFSNYRHIGDVIDNAFEKGSGAIYRSDKEVCFEGVAPGLTYRTSYILEYDADPPALTVSTTVHYVKTKGEIYFFFVMPIHKMIVPYMLDRMSKATVKANP